MLHKSTTIIVGVVSRFIVPFIQLFALYVIAHGHYSPGGGFQGGALLGASILLLRLSVGKISDEKAFPRTLSTPMSGVGVLTYAAVGVVAMAGGGLYLDYGHLPLGSLDSPSMRSLGILIIEVGVAIGVMATMIAIFDDLVRGSQDD
jgi:multicomponent Na+:H+ antiporter subunit B